MKHRLTTLTALALAWLSTFTLAANAPKDDVAPATTASTAQAVTLPSPVALRDDICWVAPEWLDD